MDACMVRMQVFNCCLSFSLIYHGNGYLAMSTLLVNTSPFCKITWKEYHEHEKSYELDMEYIDICICGLAPWLSWTNLRRVFLLILMTEHWSDSRKSFCMLLQLDGGTNWADFELRETSHDMYKCYASPSIFFNHAIILEGSLVHELKLSLLPFPVPR